MKKTVFFSILACVAVGATVAEAYHNFFFRRAEDITSGILPNERIGDNSIHGRKIAGDAIVSTHIANGSIQDQDIANNTIQGKSIGYGGEQKNTTKQEEAIIS